MAKRRRSRGVVQSTWIDWTPELAVYFPFIRDDWKRPAKVRVVASRTGFTVYGRFVWPSGNPTTITTRVRKPTKGDAYIDSSSMKVSVGGVSS